MSNRWKAALVLLVPNVVPTSLACFMQTSALG
jgi:hypothetical protein